MAKTVNSAEDSCTVMMDGVSKTFTAGLVCRKRLLHVLQGIDLQIHVSTIFGLLGPSGCGKTTLLKCIVGNLAPESGKVLVFGHKPGTKANGIPGNKVGYMPQDIALTEELTMNETLRYFGNTCGMHSKHIENRIAFLAKLLHLEPYQNQLLANLSGGQKRRVSFAVALIHEPPLLILDEPTVGLDPLMRDSVWNHLKYIASTSLTTILITTHYIEEARSSNHIGLMLNGKIVAQGTPNSLIEEYRASNLEEVFLSVSLKLREEEEMELQGVAVNTKEKDENREMKRLIPNSVCYKNSNSNNHVTTKTKTERKLLTGIQLSATRFFALVMKTIIFSFRNPASIVLEVIVPPLLLTAFSLCVGKPLFDLSLGVFNEDSQDLGQLYLSAIDQHTIRLHWFNDYETAMKSYKDGDVWGVLHLKSNFTESTLQRTTQGILSDNKTLEESSINVTLDSSNSQVTAVVHSELLSAFLKFSQALTARLGLHPDLIGIPLKINGKTEAQPFMYDQFLLPGFILALTYFTAMGSTALNRATDKQMGCTARLCVSGVTPIDLVFSELFVHLLLFVIEAIVDFVVVFWLFGYECRGSLVLAFLMVILHGVCGMSFGIMISAVTDYVATAMITCIAVFFIGIMMQGVLWPLESVPYALRYVCMTLMSTLPVEGMRDIVNRGWNLWWFPVYMGMTMSIVWSIVFLSASVIIFHVRL